MVMWPLDDDSLCMVVHVWVARSFKTQPQCEQKEDENPVHAVGEERTINQTSTIFIFECYKPDFFWNKDARSVRL